MPTKKPAKTDSKPKVKNKIIPTRLPSDLLEEIDVIAKTEKMTRAEVLRRSAEAFVFNYKNDQLDQRQLKLEKRMQTMETAPESAACEIDKAEWAGILLFDFALDPGFSKAAFEQERLRPFV